MDSNLKVNELAALFCVTARTISDLARRGIIARRCAKASTVTNAVRRYVSHLREAAAGRGQAAGGAAAVSERARLAAAQADAQEMKNRVAGGKLLDSDRGSRRMGEHPEDGRGPRYWRRRSAVPGDGHIGTPATSRRLTMRCGPY